MSAAIASIAVGSFEIDEAIELGPDPTTTREGNEKDVVRVIRDLLPDLVLFHNKDGEAYITCTQAGRRVTYPVNSTRFKQLVRAVFYDAMESALSARLLSDVTDQFAAEAQFKGVTREVHRRVAEHDGAVIVDLSDGTGRVVRITPAGWDVCTVPEVVFIDDPRCGPLPEPQRGGTIDDLRPFVNIASPEDFWLLTGFLVTCFRTRGPYPVLLIDGPQGSAKSTMTKLVKKLVDPTRPLASRMSGKTEDLLISAKHTWLLAYDNLSGLHAQASDTLCTIATGGGFATRRFHTNTEEVYFEVCGPVILNGIDGIAERGDLADRGIHLELAAIPPNARRDEETFWADFDRAHAKIFGAQCDAVATALRRLATVRLARMPRMADVARWITAAEVSFGVAEGTFLEAYETNREEALVAVAEADPIALEVAQFVRATPRTGPPMEMTATKLLELLNARRADGWFDRTWPRTAASLSNRLRRAQQALQTLGIHVTSFRQGKAGVRMIRLELVATTLAPRNMSTVSGVSAVSAPSDAANSNGAADGPADDPSCSPTIVADLPSPSADAADAADALHASE